MYNDKKLFIIVDFNATKRNSHHWTYIEAYKNILCENNLDYEIWVPINIDPEVIDTLGSRVRPILKSIVYGFQRSQNIIAWFIDKTFTLLISRLNNFFNTQLMEITKSSIFNFYSSTPLNEIKRHVQSNTEINIVLTTADSSALRFVERCLQKGLRVRSISIRSIGVSFKDPFKIYSAENFYNQLIAKYPKCEIKIGYETEPYKNILLEKSIPSNHVFWTPIPARKRVRVSTNRLELSLGFLGTARPNKGFDDIPILIEALINENINFIARVQKAEYPWPTYLNSLNKLYRYGDYVEMLPENISQKTLEYMMATTDILVLPYKPNDYVVAGSGLLFMAADFNVPILATAGVAFEWDIKYYALGKTYSTVNDFIDQIREISNSKINFGFEAYNSERIQAINKFLKIGIK
jgi:hypothetical protein